MAINSNHSIRQKLTRIIMLTSTTTLLLACLGFGISDLVSMRKDEADDLSTIAEVTGSDGIAALTFGDREGAREVLTALHAKPSIITAAIYTDRGETYARYEPNGSISIPRTPLKDGFYDHFDRLELFYPIQQGHKRIGTLYIASDARDRNARLRQYAGIAAGIVLVSLLFAFFLSSRLQRQISEPIVELARVASLVSQHKDFSMRATPRGLGGGDEIGRLMTGFNNMLSEIEQRDGRLLVAKNAADVSAEVSAQLARESALILSSTSDGIMRVDLHNQPSFINPAGEKMLGRSLHDLHGKSVHESIHHSHDDGSLQSEIDCQISQAIHRGDQISTTDDTFWRPDGSSFPVECSARPMLDDHGNKLGTVITFRDVTERRAVERMKGEFVSTVSHELRTPLTSIRGALGLLGSGLLGPIAEKGQRMLDIAISNTDRLVRLINDILDLERVGSGKVEMSRSPVDANALVLQAAEGLQAMASEARVRLVIEPATGRLWGDADRIIQTLTNLIGNAIKFSPADTAVTLSGTAREKDFVFCVADEGRGVPAEKLDAIFERFSQVDSSDSREIGGTGLGLAICKSIVTAHGGRIWAEGNDPAGSRFQFTIPLANRSTAARPVQSPSKCDDEIDSLDPARDALSILLVEDDLDLARVMTTSLQNHGIRTLHASTGSQAVLLCRRHEPSLIVLDLTLPDMDGFAVVSALRESATLGRIPLIVYSALEVASSDQPRLRLGPTKYLTKSRCSLPELVSCASDLLNTAAAPLELIPRIAL